MNDSMLNKALQQYLTFSLRDEHFGIAIDSVKEIIEYANITTIPLMPDFVKGVLNLRGDVVPVIDLSLRFGKKATSINDRTCIIILELLFEEHKVTLGAVVDHVSEVVDVAEEDIEAPPSFGAKIRAQFIKGVTNIDGQFVILLRAERVLSVEEMAAVIENVVEK